MNIENPKNLSFSYNPFLASDEMPVTLKMGDECIHGDSPEECVEEVVKKLKELKRLKEALKTFL